MDTPVTQTRASVLYAYSPAGSTIWEEGGLGSFRNWDLAEESGIVEIGLESLSLAPLS